MKKLLYILAIGLMTACGQPEVKTYEVLVTGPGTEFTLRVEAVNENNIKREARTLLLENGYPVDLANKLKFNLIK